MRARFPFQSSGIWFSTAAANLMSFMTLPACRARVTLQVQQAIDAINALATTLNNELMPLVQQHIN